MSVWVLVPARGFPGGALLSVVERFREHGIDHSFASERAGDCEGEGGVRVTASCSWDDIDPRTTEALIVLDDDRGHVAASETVVQLIEQVARSGHIVAGIGRGVLALAAADVLADRPVATTPELANELARRGAEPLLHEPFVIHGNILTATDEGAPALADELDSFRGVEGSPLHPV